MKNTSLCIDPFWAKIQYDYRPELDQKLEKYNSKLDLKTTRSVVLILGECGIDYIFGLPLAHEKNKEKQKNGF